MPADTVVTLEFKLPDLHHDFDSVNVASDLNNWDTNDKSFLLSYDDESKLWISKFDFKLDQLMSQFKGQTSISTSSSPLSPSPLKIHYKFVTNGTNWICDAHQLIERDENGIENNYLLLSSDKLSKQVGEQAPVTVEEDAPVEEETAAEESLDTSFEQPDNGATAESETMEDEDEDEDEYESSTPEPTSNDHSNALATTTTPSSWVNLSKMYRSLQWFLNCILYLKFFRYKGSGSRDDRSKPTEQEATENE